MVCLTLMSYKNVVKQGLVDIQIRVFVGILMDSICASLGIAQLVCISNRQANKSNGFGRVRLQVKTRLQSITVLLLHGTPLNQQLWCKNIVLKQNKCNYKITGYLGPEINLLISALLVVKQLKLN